MADGWSVRLEEREAVVRAYLEHERDWSAYMLGDLDPPYRAHARYYLAAVDGAERAAVLVYAPPEFTAIVTMGEPDGVAAVLAAVPDMPAETSLNLLPDHRPLIERAYAAEEWWPMRRLALGAADLRLPDGLAPARRLTPADLDDIQRLLSARDYFAPFTPAMLEHGIYCGIRHAGHLVAVAGTHIISPASRVAAVGNIYTAPEHRRQGYALATTAAVVRELVAGGCERVVLNVHSQNETAIRVYRRLGFADAGPFWEVPTAQRRS